MKFEKLIDIYDRLQDEESRELFTLMLKKAMSSNSMEYMPELAAHCHNPLILDEKFNVKLRKCQGIIIYGCGTDGRISKLSLEKCGYDVECFCDTYKSGITVDDTDVINVNEAIIKYPNHLFCICSRNYANQMNIYLQNHNVSPERIYAPPNGFLVGVNWYNQYIDTMTPPIGGVIIDAGAYDITTTKRFINWIGEDKYKKIVCYEPVEQLYQNICKKIIEYGLKNVEVINAGLWDTTTELNFISNTTGSASINLKGKEIVKCATIDETIDEKVSFIKMDIEGAELKALQGAKKTIIRDKPKMAICIYHKNSDIYEIGAFIIDIWPDCKLTIRHYGTYKWETILYVE